jgi:D-Tyr-tRNAtyr deacylase
MIALIQRVANASVEVDGKAVSLLSFTPYDEDRIQG